MDVRRCEVCGGKYDAEEHKKCPICEGKPPAAPKTPKAPKKPAE